MDPITEATPRMVKKSPYVIVCQLALHLAPTWPIMATSPQKNHNQQAAHSSVQFTDNEERWAKGSRRTLSMCPGLDRRAAGMARDGSERQGEFDGNIRDGNMMYIYIYND